MGKKIQNYILQNSIGAGQFGKVYKAYNQKTNAVVAIKVIQVQKFRLSPKLQEFTINQINTLSKMEDTTHIVKFIQILKTANNYYFVYQFCNQGTLQEKIKSQGKFPEEKALIYFKQLLQAFKMLVRNNIMHRDIKPSNILLHNGVIKLADFGFCKPLKDSKDLAQTMLGSPIYMAPQILKGQIYTMKADIWSLGVVLYQMLYGFCPFQQRSIAKLINLIQDGTVCFPTNVKISSKTQQLLRKMLVKDQFKRIEWNQLFAYNLDNDLSNYRSITNNQQISNPFSKKHFNSVLNDPQERKALSPLDYTNRNNIADRQNDKNRKRSNTVNDIREIKNQDYQSNNGKTNIQLQMKKVKSIGVSDVDKKMIQNLLQIRQKISKGIKMIQTYLAQSSSKLTVYVCCFIYKKIKNFDKDMSQIIQKMKSQWQNKENNQFMTSQFLKIIQILSSQRKFIQEKFQPFQNQFKFIMEPQDIIYMRYGEQQDLTQKKDGLVQLLQIDDYLSISFQKQVSGSNFQQNYISKSKKQLLDEYQKRILRNE